MVLVRTSGSTDQPTANCSETDMWAIGNSVKDMVEVPFTILTEANMRENGEKITNTAMVFSLLKMVLNMLDHLKMIECLKDKFHRKKLIK